MNNQVKKLTDEELKNLQSSLQQEMEQRKIQDNQNISDEKQKKSNNSYPQKVKQRAIELRHLNNTQIAQKLNKEFQYTSITEGNVRYWFKNILSKDQANYRKKNSRRIKQSKFPQMEELVMKKIKEIRDKGGKVLGQDIKTYSLAYIDQDDHFNQMLEQQIKENGKNKDQLSKEKLLLYKRNIFNASNGWKDRFIKRQGLAMRVCTKDIRQLQNDLTQKVIDYILDVKQEYFEAQFKNLNNKNVILCNHDQTGIVMSYDGKITYEQKGKKQVYSAENTNEKARFTAWFCTFSDGTKCSPFLIFKVPKNQKKRIPNYYPNDISVQQNENGWVSQQLYEMFYNFKILPKIQQNPHTFFIIQEDQCPVHTSKSSNEFFEQFKEEAKLKYNCTIVRKLIPAGTTSICQPYDTHLAAPLKQNYRSKVKEYKIQQIKNQDLNKAGSLKKIPYQVVQKYLLESWKLIKDDLVIKSFKQNGYSLEQDQVHQALDRQVILEKFKQQWEDLYNQFKNSKKFEEYYQLKEDIENIEKGAHYEVQTDNEEGDEDDSVNEDTETLIPLEQQTNNNLLQDSNKMEIEENQKFEEIIDNISEEYEPQQNKKIKLQNQQEKEDEWLQKKYGNSLQNPNQKTNNNIKQGKVYNIGLVPQQQKQLTGFFTIIPKEQHQQNLQQKHLDYKTQDDVQKKQKKQQENVIKNTRKNRNTKKNDKKLKKKITEKSFIVDDDQEDNQELESQDSEQYSIIYTDSNSIRSQDCYESDSETSCTQSMLEEF